MGGSVGAERAEGDGVGAALGGEVAPESEHVRPRGQAQFLELRELAEAEARGDVTSGVVTDGEVGQPVVGSDAAIEGAGAFGGLGGVLGYVPATLVSVTSPLAVMARISSWRPQVSVRAGSPGAVGAVTLTALAAWSMAAVSSVTVAQAGGVSAGPEGPSSLMMAWKWTTPRRWYSATLA
jgi:hypothetical protein